MSDELFNLREGGKKKPAFGSRPGKQFRLEQHITLASSDKYNDPYECEVHARQLRDRYVVSVTITHDPVTTRVYSNSWIFKDMATCWEKYHGIVATVEDIRNFIEAEGLKSVVFQYMVKHALSSVAADVGNIYEDNLPLTRQIIDHSTRGNIIKNFPTVPFTTQSGPDQLDQVYSAVGTAENPVPQDNIQSMSQRAISQSERRDMGLKDVLPNPISKFQEAAGITPQMFKGAANTKEIKTAADGSDQKEKFIQNVKDNAPKAIAFGKNLAIKHYMAMTGADEAEGDAFYHGVKALCSKARAVLNISASNLLLFMVDNEYKPIAESPELSAKFNHFAAKREQAERAMGCFGLNPAYASITFLEEGDWGYGKCAMTLDDIANDAVLLCGDSFRLRNPTRIDYVADPNLVLYPFSALDDCKASSIIIGMKQHDLAAGPAEALSNIMDDSQEFGRCEAIIFKTVTPRNVIEIVAHSEETAKTIRKILMRMGRVMPVATSTDEPKIIYAPADKEMDDEPATKNVPQKHFTLGDRIMTKRTANHFQPSILGTIIDVANGNITVQWDNEERSIFDMGEALFRLMDAPKQAETGKGMIVYNLPGMDDQTVLILSGSGIDPVSLYSLASMHNPASDALSGALQNMIKSMSNLGLHGSVVVGYAPTDGEESAFGSKQWIEAKLQTGARLIVDLSPEGMKIIAGDSEDYILPINQPKIEIE